MSETKTRCCKAMWTDGMHGSPCGATASIERDGKHYCKRHDPVARKAAEDKRRAERQARWDAMDKARAEADAIRDRADACAVAMQGIPDPAAFVKAFGEMERALALIVNGELARSAELAVAVSALSSAAKAKGEGK